MKWIVILSFDFSTMYFEKQILIIWNNYEFSVLANYKVKCVYNQSKNCECVHIVELVVIIKRNNFVGIDNLTLDPFFGHNLCFKYPNGSCKPILNIYISRTFQWFKELFKSMSLTPIISLWRFKSPLGLQFPKWDLIWKCVGSFLHILLHSQEHEMWLPNFILGQHLCKPFFWLQT